MTTEPCAAGASVIPFKVREDTQTMPFSLAITFLLISIESLLLRKWLKFYLHKGIPTQQSQSPPAVLEFILADEIAPQVKHNGRTL